jgi:hypothetical protein
MMDRMALNSECSCLSLPSAGIIVLTSYSGIFHLNCHYTSFCELAWPGNLTVTDNLGFKDQYSISTQKLSEAAQCCVNW